MPQGTTWHIYSVLIDVLQLRTRGKQNQVSEMGVAGGESRNVPAGGGETPLADWLVSFRTTAQALCTGYWLVRNYDSIMWVQANDADDSNGRLTCPTYKWNVVDLNVTSFRAPNCDFRSKWDAARGKGMERTQCKWCSS